MNVWIFEDNNAAVDKVIFMRYLSEQNISVQGHFKDIIDDDEKTAWRYPAYAAEKFGKNKKTLEKIRILAADRGNSKNDVERNFNNQLEEFKGLYCMCHVLGYDFIDWDRPCEKAGVSADKNCDFALMKDGNTYYADVKDCSGGVMSQKGLDELMKNPNDPTNEVLLKHNIPGTLRYAPKTDLNPWLLGQIRDADDKGADILICHFPWKGMPCLTQDDIRKDYKDMLGNTVQWDNGYPILSSGVTTNLHAIVAISKLGCWIIKVKSMDLSRLFVNKEQ